MTTHTTTSQPIATRDERWKRVAWTLAATELAVDLEAVTEDDEFTSYAEHTYGSRARDAVAVHDVLHGIEEEQ